MMLRDRSKITTFFVLSGVCLLLLFAGYSFENNQFFQPLKEALQERRITTNMLDNGTLGKIIKHLELVEVELNEGKRFQRTAGNEIDELNRLNKHVDELTFQRKREPDQFLYRPVEFRSDHQFDPHDLVEAIPQKQKWPLLSIKIPERSLYDPDIGLLRNRDKYGKDWERKADVVFYDEGGVLFSSSAGLRIHGGKRRTVQPYQSYRLYFRDEYGAEHIPAGVILKDSGVIRTLVVHLLDWPPGQPMNNQLAYDISRQIGAPAPETRLFEVYINGRSEGMAFVTEHLSRRQFDQYMTGNDYIFLKYKNHISEAETKAYFNNLWRYVVELELETYSVLEKKLDIDSFSRHVFALVFTGDDDYCQGVGVLDSENPEAKFYWIQWDMDHSFFDRTAEITKIKRENWQQAGFKLIYKDGEHDCDRTTIFSGLMDKVPRYRSYAIDLYTEILNHRLTPEFLSSRVDYYASMLSSFGNYDHYVDLLRNFMANRSDFIRADMAKRFNLSGPHNLSVSADSSILLEIDGYHYNGTYDGKYFSGQTIEIKTDYTSSLTTFSHWLVNGEQQFTENLTVTIHGNTKIELVSLPNET